MFLELNFGLQHFDLIAVGIVTAGILILGFSIFFNNRRSITNRAFLYFALLTVAYGFFNYINYQISSIRFILFFQRLTIFFAVWHALSFFYLFYVFPQTEKTLSKIYKFGLIPVAIFTALLTLTPAVFSGIEIGRAHV